MKERSMNRIEARKKAEVLVSKMTLEEKSSQLKFNAPAIRRLGVPAYNWWCEALHGVARAGTATMFPQAIGMGASFDRKLVRDMAAVIAEEARAKYNAYSKHGDRDIYKGLTFWAPNVNIFRDPRWGRGQETYGEDPFLTSRLGVSYVEGLQGKGPVMKAAACAKHFAVHSGPEAVRHSFNAEVSQKDLYETYLPAFHALVTEAKVEAVMGAYNRTNGEPCSGSKTLLKKILREDWGFEGHVVSDCWALVDFHEHHKVTKTPEESAALAMSAGCDLNCGKTYQFMTDAVKLGLITEDQITEAAVRLFTTRYLLGIMDGSSYDKIPYSAVESGSHLALAEKAACRSMVLLKNDGILPLDKKKLHSISVIGPNADSRAALIGNYHGTSSEYITVLEGIRRTAGRSVRIYYSEGCDISEPKTEGLAQDGDRIAEAVTAAEMSDAVILCLGLNESLEGEEMDTGNHVGSGDKTDLLLPEPQRRLMEAVAKTGKPVILCLMAGSDIDLSYADQHFSAILDLWYPGARGGKAAAEVLFGQKEPGGKLPVTFYRSEKDLPEFTDYAMKDRTYRYMKKAAQFPFGFGLTYSPCTVEKAELIGEPSFEKDLFVQMTVRNTGKRKTEEVLQVYLKKKDAADAKDNYSLCAFERISVLPGKTAAAKLRIPKEALLTIDEEGHAVREGRHFQLFAGLSQPDQVSEKRTGMKPVRIDFIIKG
jgi:beta-glucosidase